MKTRIARAIVGVTTLVVVALGLPFAIVVQRFYESRATIELQRAAAEVIVELTLPLHTPQIAAAAREPDAPEGFSVYDEAGSKLFGEGPLRVDGSISGDLVVITPISDPRTEAVAGFVRVGRSRASIAGQARRAWALMALAAAGTLGLSVLLARREAARLAAPIAELAARAERLGAGQFEQAPAPTGTIELDTLGAALSASAVRLAELVAREREFSANASHQLRTPLAGLCMSLDRGDLGAARAEAERLSSTVDHLLALARNSLPQAELTQVGPVVAQAAERWADAFRRSGRSLAATIGPMLPSVRVRPTSVEQAVEVLLDNALRHGAGTTRITARPAPNGLVIQVDDDGPGIVAERAESVFARHESAGNGTGTGIGLALARTLLEGDGGRLLLTDPDRAEFRIVLAAASSNNEQPPGREGSVLGKSFGASPDSLPRSNE